MNYCEDCKKLTGGFCQEHSYEGGGVIGMSKNKIQPITQVDLDAIKGRAEDWFGKNFQNKVIESETIRLIINKVNEVIMAQLKGEK